MHERLRNGTLIETGPDWARTTLPCGAVVEACPNEDSPRMAHELGYGSDVARLTTDHDPLHARLTDMLGMPYSFALMRAAGEDACPVIAAYEEAAVLACQRLLTAWRGR